jgi:hypothetical protein
LEGERQRPVATKVKDEKEGSRCGKYLIIIKPWTLVCHLYF